RRRDHRPRGSVSRSEAGRAGGRGEGSAPGDQITPSRRRSHLRRPPPVPPPPPPPPLGFGPTLTMALPLIVELTVSVTAIVWMATVFSVTLKPCTPLSLAPKVESEGRPALVA